MDRDNVIMESDLKNYEMPIKTKKVDRSFKFKVSNQEPITVEELV